jgi:beta-N-acetylhexosaminidase
MKHSPKAVIFGIRGKELLPEELDFIKEYNPLGFILFSRNIDNQQQVKSLVRQLKSATSRLTPILIDQEGGRVARLKQPNWRHPPEASIFGQIAKHDIKAAIEACKINSKLMAYDLYQLGINTDCAPVLDITFPETHSVIGNRAFSDDKKLVYLLAQEMIKGFLKCGICPIVKHIPGHGRAQADSHLKLPIVDVSYKTLRENDFYPFAKLNNAAKWAMTAHILYTSIDPKNPATFSAKVINEIRQEIGFKGIIITDCITMKALEGTMAEKAEKSFTAGCDIVLHTNSNLDEMLEIVKVSPNLTELQLLTIEESYAQTKSPAKTFNYVNSLKQFDNIISRFKISSNYLSGFDPTEQLH